jgi:hypothetical protein
LKRKKLQISLNKILYCAIILIKERHLLVTDAFHMVPHSKGGANREFGTYLSRLREAPIPLATGWAFLFFLLTFSFFDVRKKRNNQAEHRT